MSRHIGTYDKEGVSEMLKEVNFGCLQQLMDKVVPDGIKLQEFSVLGEGLSQKNFLEYIKEIAEKNKIYKSYIGLGYYDSFLPPVIARCLLENPGWYTQYTPYQAEISQGRLESLLNFQTIVCDLTSLPVSNASLLDEATAAAEAMFMAYRINKQKSHKFFVSEKIFPQTIGVIKTKASALGIVVEVGDLRDLKSSSNLSDFFGVVLQYPDESGNIEDHREIIEKLKENKIITISIADILSLALLKPPGEWGVDIAVGSTQRLGVPIGYGGPHAAYLATRDEHKRFVPGRVIGVTKDKFGNVAFRMSLQTREQHIRREKANSNICTAQALLANIAAMYVIYHGKEGIKKIAMKIHQQTRFLVKALKKLGFKIENDFYFDTITLVDAKEVIDSLHRKASEHLVNFRKFSAGDKLGISLDETCEEQDLATILEVFRQVKNEAEVNFAELDKAWSEEFAFPEGLVRTSEYLNHDIFNTIKSESQMLRYLNFLEKKDLSLNTSMIPLGSCTMKLNSAAEMMPISWKAFSGLHPFVPKEQALGFREVFDTLEEVLEKITGMDRVSLQPNSGAQGEYAGLLSIRNYLDSIGESKRDVVLIPSSAHGTNPASAVLAGMKVIVVKCLDNGDTDVGDLESKAKENAERLAALMITYPSTHGVFEVKIREICDLIHRYGGQVYMDGANLNAQVGYTNPGLIGADVCHLNLHKTFAIPHGGGGPGVGPIAVKKHLIPFLPGHCLVPIEGREENAISAAPWGSASILIISLAYLKLLGNEGVKEATAFAILNSNYVKSRIEKHYPVLYTAEDGLVAHELIIDVRDITKETGIQAEDIAKRLMDFGFHAPTMSWPVANTLMIEPTESEDKEELDRFCDALICIRSEIKDIEEGKSPKDDNPLKNAPHSIDYMAHGWDKGYSMEKAFFPLPYVKRRKFWPSVARVDNVHGDRNFYCTCPPLESYK